MRVVHHHDAVVFFGEIAESGEIGDVAVHGKNAVGDEQLLAIPVFGFFQDAAAVGGVFVFENFDGGAGEAAAVDDRGVIQLVGDDEIFFAEDRGDGSGVGGEAGLKYDAGFDFFEAAICSSRSMCIFMVPAMVRTAPEPTPNLRVASMAARRSLGCVVRPR